MKHLIVTGDDFGRSIAVNEAIEQAHRAGVLSAASLMVAEPAAQDAIARAHKLPHLRVGLHIATVKARAFLTSEKAPHLVDGNGMLPQDQVGAGFRFALSANVRAELEQEIAAQFEAFAASGLTLDHVNGHCHMHLHPVVLSLILKTGARYGMKAVRLVREPGWSPLKALVIAPWNAALRRRLKAAGLSCNDTLFGVSDSGRMSADAVLACLERLPEGVSEIYCHPGAPESETRALLDPRVRAAIAGLARAPGGYGDIP